MVIYKQNSVKQKIGSFLLSPAHGKSGARATINITLPPEKFCPSAKQACKKKWSLEKRIFALLLCPLKADWGWEAARLCVSREEKPAKLFLFN